MDSSLSSIPSGFAPVWAESNSRDQIEEIFNNLIANYYVYPSESALVDIWRIANRLAPITHESRQLLIPYLLKLSQLYTPNLEGDIQFLQQLVTIFNFNEWEAVAEEHIIDIVWFRKNGLNEIFDQIKFWSAITVLSKSPETKHSALTEAVADASIEFALKIAPNIYTSGMGQLFFMRMMSMLHGRQIEIREARVIASFICSNINPLSVLNQVLSDLKDRCILTDLSWNLIFSAVFERMKMLPDIQLTDFISFVVILNALREKNIVWDTFKTEISEMFLANIKIEPGKFIPLNSQVFSKKFIESILQLTSLLNAMMDEAKTQKHADNIAATILSVLLCSMTYLETDQIVHVLLNLTKKKYSFGKNVRGLMFSVVIALGMRDEPSEMLKYDLTILDRSYLPYLEKFWEKCFVHYQHKYFLIVWMSSLMGISQSEILLRIMLKCPVNDAMVRLMGHAMDYYEKKQVPTLEETALIEQILQRKEDHLLQKREILRGIFTLFQLPPERVELHLVRFLKQAIAMPKMNFDEYGLTLEFMAMQPLEIDRIRFNADHKELIMKLLVRNFEILDPVNFTSEYYEFYQGLLADIVVSWGVDTEKIFPPILLNWIIACKHLFVLGRGRMVKEPELFIHVKNTTFSIVEYSYNSLLLFRSPLALAARKNLAPFFSEAAILGGDYKEPMLMWERGKLKKINLQNK